MNINILPTPAMIAISGEWLESPVIAMELCKRELGASLWKEIQAAHVLAVARSRERMAIEARITELIKLGVRFDDIHDDRAHVLYHLLLLLAAATRDAALAEFLRRVHALMFPHGLRIVHMSYLAEAGAAMELEVRVTPEILARLESVRVADQTLADIYRAWVEAGKELGRSAQERTRLERSLGMEGTTAPRTHARKVRSVWIRAVRLLLDALDLLDLSESTREQVLAPLERGIQTALARRAQGNGDIDDDIEPDAPAPDAPAPDAPDAPALLALDASAAPELDAAAMSALEATAMSAFDAPAMSALDARPSGGEPIA
jgi:hypothetical protein